MQVLLFSFIFGYFLLTLFVSNDESNIVKYSEFNISISLVNIQKLFAENVYFIFLYIKVII